MCGYWHPKIRRASQALARSSAALASLPFGWHGTGLLFSTRHATFSLRTSKTRYRGGRAGYRCASLFLNVATYCYTTNRLLIEVATCLTESVHYLYQVMQSTNLVFECAAGHQEDSAAARQHRHDICCRHRPAAHPRRRHHFPL